MKRTRTAAAYTEDLDDEGNEKPSEDADEKAAEEEAMEAVENGPLTDEKRAELLKTPPRRPECPPQPERGKPASGGVHRQEASWATIWRSWI